MRKDDIELLYTIAPAEEDKIIQACIMLIDSAVRRGMVSVGHKGNTSWNPDGVKLYGAFSTLEGQLARYPSGLNKLRKSLINFYFKP
jgi:hypothetical protein